MKIPGRRWEEGGSLAFKLERGLEWHRQQTYNA